MKLINETEWDSRDLRRVIMRCLYERGVNPKDYVIHVTKGRTKYSGYTYLRKVYCNVGRGGRYAYYIRLRVPDVKRTVKTETKSSNIAIECMRVFDVKEFSRVLLHEIDHTRGLRHDEMISYWDIKVPFAKDYVVYPKGYKEKQYTIRVTDEEKEVLRGISVQISGNLLKCNILEFAKIYYRLMCEYLSLLWDIREQDRRVGKLLAMQGLLEKMANEVGLKFKITRKRRRYT